MALIPLIGSGPVTPDELNNVANALDVAFEALFAGRSPLVWLPLTGSPSWYESRISGVLYVFGTQASRRILASEPSHNQGAIDAAVVAAPTIQTPTSAYDHTLKQVTIDDSAVPGGVQRSLKAHKKEVNLVPELGGKQDYWCRTMAVWPEGQTPIFHHEHRHTLAVADVVFEAHVSRTFTWPAAWDKFSCVRFHNLDPDPAPIHVTFERTDGAAPDVLTLPRWNVASVRRKVDGQGWQKDGFLLFGVRPGDVERLGSTAPWADRVGAHGVGARPDLNVRYADGANNVASFASVWCWLEYFSRGITPEVAMSQNGTYQANDKRTGIWFNPLSATNRVTALPPLGNPEDDATVLLNLSTHGGSFRLAEWHGAPPDQTLVVATYSATFDQLLAGHAQSGLVIFADNAKRQLFLRRMADAEWWNADLVPISTNLVGGLPIAVPHDALGVQIPVLGPPQLIDVWRASASSATETVYGIGDTPSLVHQFLGGEVSNATSDSGAPLGWTVGAVKTWTFQDGTRFNAHSAFGTSVYRWDGRVFTAAVECTVAPADGAFFSGGLADMLSRENVLTETGAVLHWRQRDDALTYPALGGVWMDPAIPRVSWPIASASLFWHPHVVDPVGEPGGADWYAAPMDTAPPSEAGVRRLEGVGEAVQTSLSTPPIVANDSIEMIAANMATPDWWKTNRDAALAGAVLPNEVRPVIGVPLMHYHFNALASRLNSISEVVPFSFLDAQWYGRPFREPLGRAGIYGGHIYPAGHLANAPAGSQTRSRAQDLGIPIRDFSSSYPSWAELSQTRIMSKTLIDNETVEYEAFPSLNLLNDLYCWFWSGAILAVGEVTGFVNSEEPVPPGWFRGNPVNVGGHFQYDWAGYNNGEAVVPDFSWVTLGDVKSKAVELGLPFHVERLSIGYKVHVFFPATSGSGGVRVARSLIPGLLGTQGPRTQAMLAVAPGTEIEFEQVAGRGLNDGDPFYWSWAGLVRLARWPFFPDYQNVYATTEPLVMETIMALDQGYNRPGIHGPAPAAQPFVLLTSSNPSSGQEFSQWFHAGSFHDGEAPRVLKLVIRDGEHIPAGWKRGPSVLWAAPCPAAQWGPTDLQMNPAPGGGFRVLDAVGLPDIISPDDLAPAGWNGRGAWQVSLHSGGVRPPVPV